MGPDARPLISGRERPRCGSRQRHPHTPEAVQWALGMAYSRAIAAGGVRWSSRRSICKFRSRPLGRSPACCLGRPRPTWHPTRQPPGAGHGPTSTATSSRSSARRQPVPLVGSRGMQTLNVARAGTSNPSRAIATHGRRGRQPAAHPRGRTVGDSSIPAHQALADSVMACGRAARTASGRGRGSAPLFVPAACSGTPRIARAEHLRRCCARSSTRRAARGRRPAREGCGGAGRQQPPTP